MTLVKRSEVLPPRRKRHFLSFSTSLGSRLARKRWWALDLGLSSFGGIFGWIFF